MKKRKKTETAGPEFDHRPFKDLKGKVRSEPAAAKASKVDSPSLQESADDQELFLRAVGDVKQPGVRQAARTRGIRAADRAKQNEQEAEERDKSLFLKALAEFGPSLRAQAPVVDEYDQALHHSSAAGRMRQLKRGTIKISEELDLHGMLKDEALHRLGHFIASAFAKGRKAVLVITGKGINSPEGPVLQGAVAAWLREQGRGMVAEFHPAPRDKGGSGAYVVFLRTKKK